MQISLNDVWEIGKILAILLASFFSFFLPLRVLTKNTNLALKLTIPVSISIQILFGYIFYCFFKISNYPVYFLALISLLNIGALIKLKPRLKSVKVSLNWKIILVVLVLTIATIYHFFFDAFTNYAPGAIDTIAHINFLFVDLNKYGFLSFPSYPPGFHIFLYPLTLVSSQIPVYRFAGPLLGIITLSSLLLIYKDIFKHKISIILLVSLLIFPVFNPLTLQLIGFFSTSLSFIFIIFLPFVILNQDLAIRSKIMLSVIVFAAMALTIPYLIVQLIPIFIVLTIFSYFYYKPRDPKTHKTISAILIILLCSFLLAFGHVYLQSSILKRTSGFPAIDTVESTGNNLTIGNTYQKNPDFIEQLPPILKKIAEKPLIRSYILPMYFTGIDIVNIKNIRGLNSLLSIGAYCLIAIALATFILLRKNLNLALLSIFVIVFGICVQTGVFEIGTYRGRSGYYMLLFSLLLITSLADYYYKNKYRKYLLAVVAILIVSSFFYPLKYYRDYYPDYFEVAHQVLKENPNKKILFQTSRSSLATISAQIIIEPLSKDLNINSCSYDLCLLILEKNYLWLDPVLSQRSYAADKDFVNFNSWQKKTAEDQENLVNSIKNSPDVKNAQIYFENQDLVVYKIKKE